MKGSIRFFVGLIVVFGAAGGMDNPDTSLVGAVVTAVVGLAIMASGAFALRDKSSF